VTVGLLILTHSGIGPSLVGTAASLLDAAVLQTKLLNVTKDNNADDILEHAEELLRELDAGQGVLILTDLIGSTPSNIAKILSVTHSVRIVTGLNLSMILRVLNHPELDLNTLAKNAVSGGQDGIIML